MSKFSAKARARPLGVTAGELRQAAEESNAAKLDDDPLRFDVLVTDEHNSEDRNMPVAQRSSDRSV
jgi:hypothetical protein